MKCKRIKGLVSGKFVRCSFCKEKTANKQLVGGYYGGKTVCDKCCKHLKETEFTVDNDMALGEENVYNMYKAF